MPVDWRNRALGTDIDTRRLAAQTPEGYTKNTITILEKTWHRGNSTRHTFLINETEVLTGRLGYNANTQPWLRFVMSSMYASSAHALGASRAHLVRSDKDFRALTKHVRKDLRFHKSGTKKTAPMENRHKPMTPSGSTGSPCRRHPSKFTTTGNGFR